MNHVMDRPISAPWWRRRHWVAGAAALTVLLAVTLVRILLGTSEHTVRLSIGNVTIARVASGTFHDYVPLRTTVVPLETIYLDAAEGGRVERIWVQAGDNVTAGEPLIQLSNTELELDVLEREGRLIESITQLQAYQMQLEENRVANQKALAQINYDIIRLRQSLARRNVLAARSLVPREERDNIQDQLNYDLTIQPIQEDSNQKQEALRVRQLPEIEGQLAKLQEDLKITHSKLDMLTVRAPTSGRLTAMDLKVGENLDRGKRIAVITPATGDKLSADVDEYYLSRVHDGETADVDMNGRTYVARVSRVYPQVKDGTFTIDLSFDDTRPAGLLPGQEIQGRLSLGADRPALILPAGAFLERTGGNWAFVLDRDGRVARRTTIELGRRNTEQVEVLGGLAVGDRVIVSDYSGLEHADRIELNP